MKNRMKYHKKKRKIGYQLKRRYKDAIRKHLEQELYLLSQTVMTHCLSSAKKILHIV